MSEQASATLAGQMAVAALDALPDGVIEAAAVHLAAAVERATRAAPPAALAAVLLALDAPRQCSLLFSGERAGASAAAYLNAASLADAGSNFEAQQAAAVVVPACLAAAELDGRTGADLLVGVAVGIETALRLAAALGSRHEARGFTLIGSAGRIGAAVGALRTLGGSPDSTLAVLGFAATQGAGPLRAAPGASDLLGAKGAADALEAALLCHAGLIGPPAPLEGRRGLFALEYADDGAALTEGLGSRYLLAEALRPGTSESLMEAAAALAEGGEIEQLLAASRA